MHVISNYLSMISSIMRMKSGLVYICYGLPLFLFINNPIFFNYLSIGLDTLALQLGISTITKVSSCNGIHLFLKYFLLVGNDHISSHIQHCPRKVWTNKIQNLISSGKFSMVPCDLHTMKNDNLLKCCCTQLLRQIFI